MKKTIYALTWAILVQLPLGYLFLSLESLVLGHGFIDISNDFHFFLLTTLLVSAAVILLVGIPIYLTLQKLKVNSTLNVATAGFMIPVIILCIVNFCITDYANYSAGENFYGTLRSTFIAGNRTIWGWLTLAEELLKFGIHGILSATVFHKFYLVDKA